MAAQIGAKIGIDGVDSYLKHVREITNASKSMAKELDVLSSSYGSESKTLKQNNEYKKQLKDTIKSLSESIKAQKEYIIGLGTATSNAGTHTERMRDQTRRLEESIQNDTIKLNEFKKELEELNQNNALTLFVDAWQNASNKTGEALVSIGNQLTQKITKPLVGVAQEAMKTSTSYQSAFTGVRKTVDEVYNANGNLIYSYEMLNDELKKIPLSTASSYESVAGVAEIAGQLGIAANEVPFFTENIIKLADSTNLLADEGAVDLAKFLNIMGETPSIIDKVGSSIVYLGNHYATSEKDIVSLTTRLAGAGRVAGLTIPQVLGIATAMSSVGLTAEAGGTAFSQALTSIASAVANGGEKLALFGEASGMTAEQFAETWRNNPIEAVQSFISGLGSLEGGSEALILMLDELGFTGIRQSDMFRRLALNSDILTNSVYDSEKAFISDAEAINGMNYLTEEASKRYEDWNSQINQAKSALKLVADDIGKRLMPYVQKGTELIRKFADWWSKLSDQTKDNIVKVGLFVAAIGPLITIVGSAIIWFAKLKSSLEILKGTAGIGGLITKITGGGGLISTITSLGTKLITTLGPGAIAITGGIAAIALLKKGYDTNFLGMKDGIDSLFNKWSDFKNKISNKFNEMKTATTDLFSAIKSSLKQSGSENITQVNQDFQRIEDDMIRHINNGANKIRNEGSNNMYTATHKFVQTGIDEVRNLNQIKNEASSWGYDLASAYSNGISNGIQKVKNAVSNLASKVKSYLHFSEPDVGPLSDFHTYMPDMMKSMAYGITDNMYLVEDALDNLSSKMAYQLNGGVSYGGVVINLNVPQGANGYQLVDQIETEIANRTIRRKAVFE